MLRSFIKQDNTHKCMNEEVKDEIPEVKFKVRRR